RRDRPPPAATTQAPPPRRAHVRSRHPGPGSDRRPDRNGHRQWRRCGHGVPRPLSTGLLPTNSLPARRRGGRMSFWRQAMEIARVDLRVERRLGDAIKIVLPFAIMGLLVFPFAIGPRMSILSQIGMPVYWALGVLFGLQIALRQSANDTPARRELHAQLGVD